MLGYCFFEIGVFSSSLVRLASSSSSTSSSAAAAHQQNIFHVAPPTVFEDDCQSRLGLPVVITNFHQVCIRIVVKEAIRMVTVSGLPRANILFACADSQAREASVSPAHAVTQPLKS